jgi:hypothetical protein
MYFSRNRKFGSALSKLRNFGGGVGVKPHSLRHGVKKTGRKKFITRRNGRSF